MSEAESANSWLWGIDGGGTKTTVMLAERVRSGTPRVLASIRIGSSNVNSRPWNEITEELAEAIRSARQTANCPPGQAAALVAAFAGVGSPSVRQKWDEWFAAQNLAEKISIVDDGQPLIAAGLSDGWGIVLISGTGSSAFGRSKRGECARAGGWGYLFGDEGSGFDIGRAALGEITRAYDLKANLTPWMSTLSEKWNLANPREIVERVYGSDEPRRCIASVAQIICEAAERGDLQAQQILNVAAKELASLVEIVARSLRLVGDDFPLALSGGVIANSQYLQCELAGAIHDHGLKAGPITIVGEPAEGCLILAEQIADS